MFANIRALLFDLDNTLVDRDDAFRRWAAVFVGTHFPPDQTLHGAAVERIIQLDNDGYCLRADLFRQIRARYPFIEPGVDNLVAAFYSQFPDHMRLAEEATHLLDGLHRVGLPFGIVTNGSPTQLQKIHALGLDLRTSCIFVSELVGCRKPEAAIFQAAADCLGVAPESILFVGDNPEADIWGAHGVGMMTAWLHRSRTWPSALPSSCVDLTIGSLADLADVLGLGPGTGGA
jgi:putative hydrolase of the HAD superfamily